MINEEIKLDVLNEEEACNLFAQSAGDVCSAPHVKSIEDEVYLPLKLSYNSFQTLEECFNDGIALIETLKDSCFLEQGEYWAGTVKLHDVVRDVAIWISTKSGFSSESSITSCVSKQEESCTSISFMNITKLPNQLSGLQSLESLDMSFSAYKWDAKCNVEDGRATFDEIIALEQLSVVKIRLDKVDSLALDAACLRRLREFNIQISPGSCDSNHLPTQHDKRRVVLRGVDLIGRGLN
ncbi:hypothetical protein REPUB_Repub05bG0042800 [Reevesia pubescens]